MRGYMQCTTDDCILCGCIQTVWTSAVMILFVVYVEHYYLVKHNPVLEKKNAFW